MDFRRVLRLENGAFAEIAFKDLKKGDVFRLFDSLDGPVHEDGSQTYVASGDPFPVPPEGNYGIEFEHA